MGGKFIPGIYHINYIVMKYMTGSGFSMEIYEFGMVFKSIEYMKGGILKISAVRLYPKV
jgi:hypothetical protein